MPDVRGAVAGAVMTVVYEMTCAVCGGTGVKPGMAPIYECTGCRNRSGTVRVTREECIEKLLDDPAMNDTVTVSGDAVAVGGIPYQRGIRVSVSLPDALRAALKAGKP